MTNSADQSWTHAGHGLPSAEAQPQHHRDRHRAPTAGRLRRGADPELGPTLTTNLARVEKKLREAIANSDPLADATSRHLVEAGGKRIRPLLTLLRAHLGDASRARSGAGRRRR